MSSDLKIETARINGAKSHGPVTPEGKARSAENSRRHGLTAAAIVLPGESEEHFQLLLADYMDQFKPQTGVETDLVEVMAAARWRLRRLLAIETRLFDCEDETYVFEKLSDGKSLALLIRYETSINRSYDKALKQLQQLQSTRSVGSFRKSAASASTMDPTATDLDPTVTELDPTGTEPRPQGAVSSRMSQDPNRYDRAARTCSA